MNGLFDQPEDQKRPFFIMGPCVIESYDIAMRAAEKIAYFSRKYNILIIYKSSFDKANRTSAESYRGPGIDIGLEILQSVKNSFDLPVTTDIHLPSQAKVVSSIIDIIQIPAFLARQTDLIAESIKSGLPVHCKKAQHMSSHDVKNLILKAKKISTSAGCTNFEFLIGERGTSFGYNNLVVDMRNIQIISELCPVVIDVTHSIQLPGALGSTSGGQREFCLSLTRAAVAVGVSGVFLETHPSPSEAKCDRDIQWPLEKASDVIENALIVNEAFNTVRSRGLL